MLVACARAGIDLRLMDARAVRDDIAAATEVAPEEPRPFSLIVCVCACVYAHTRTLTNKLRHILETDRQSTLKIKIHILYECRAGDCCIYYI